MFPAADALGAEVGDGEVAEGEVESGQGEIHAQRCIAVFAGEFAHALGEGEGFFGGGGGGGRRRCAAGLRGVEAAGGLGEAGR